MSEAAVLAAGRRQHTISLYNNVLAKLNRLALIVDCKSTSLLIGIVIFIAATFLLTNKFNTTIAYGCIKSFVTNQTNSSSGANGNLTKPHAFVGSGHIIDIET